MIEALVACEPDTLQVFTATTPTLDTDQRVLGQLSDLYDRELVGIIGKFFFFFCIISCYYHRYKFNNFYFKI